MYLYVLRLSVVLTDVVLKTIESSGHGGKPNLMVSAVSHHNNDLSCSLETAEASSMFSWPLLHVYFRLCTYACVWIDVKARRIDRSSKNPSINRRHFRITFYFFFPRKSRRSRGKKWFQCHSYTRRWPQWHKPYVGQYGVWVRLRRSKPVQWATIP